MNWHVVDDMGNTSLHYSGGNVLLARTALSVIWPTHKKPGGIIAAGQAEKDNAVWIIKADPVDNSSELIERMVVHSGVYGIKTVFHPEVDIWVFNDYVNELREHNFSFIKSPQVEAGWAIDKTFELLENNLLKVNRKLAELVGEIEHLRHSHNFDNHSAEDNFILSPLVETLNQLVSTWRIHPKESKLVVPEKIYRDEWTGI